MSTDMDPNAEYKRKDNEIRNIVQSSGEKSKNSPKPSKSNTRSANLNPQGMKRNPGSQEPSDPNLHPMFRPV